jgi:DNA-binding transcriptional ArsR family regulator
VPGKSKVDEPHPDVTVVPEAPLPAVQLSDYELASELLRALSTPMRLAIVDLLTAAPRCVHELVDAVGASQPLVSQHLRTLRSAGLVSTQRRGREMVYRLVDEHVAHVARDTLQHAREIAGSA